VVAGDDRINRRDRETHEDALSLLARECPVAGDLRLVAAPLDIIRCVERMAELVRSQVSQAEQAFDTRDVALARELVGRDSEVNRLEREVFGRAVEVGDDLEVREWAMLMILVARCLERIAENTVFIAEQTVFIVIGLFREIESAAQLA